MSTGPLPSPCANPVWLTPTNESTVPIKLEKKKIQFLGTHKIPEELFIFLSHLQVYFPVQKGGDSNSQFPSLVVMPPIVLYRILGLGR